MSELRSEPLQSLMNNQSTEHFLFTPIQTKYYLYIANTLYNNDWTDNIDTPTFTHLDQHSSSGAIPLDLCTLLEKLNIKNAHHGIVFDNLEGICDGSILVSNASMLMIWFCVSVSVFCINISILHLSPVKLELSNWQVKVFATIQEGIMIFTEIFGWECWNVTNATTTSL